MRMPNGGEALPKQSKNLSLDPEAVRRGERYSELHRTNLSQLVGNFLSGLPIDSESEGAPLSPAVRRLIGVGAGETDLEDYRRWLVEKHGR
jgi:hypothetical protein